MASSLTIRAGTREDWPALRTLYAEAFPEEVLLPLVEALMADPAFGVCSLVALLDDRVVGHIVMTPCSVGGTADPIALLGPLGVRPDAQGKGVGSALVRAGCDAMQQRGCGQVLVLGDPAYYGRFGFRQSCTVTPPHPIPAAWKHAWQALDFDAAGPPASGRLQVPPPWRDPALWTS
ncbi:MAG: N-acetyltransferase [Pseudomonadota bacterium]